MQYRKKFVRRPWLTQEETSRSWGAHLQVLGSGAADQAASVLLTTANKKYLFNCGENIGRFSQDQKVSLKKVDQTFFTQSKWNCIGGVTSLIFATVASTGFPPKFHGPKNLHPIVQRMIFLSSLGGLFKHRFRADTFDTGRLYEDHRVVIKSVELKRLQEDTAIIYMCKLKECRGKFSIKKSIDRKVPIDLVGKLAKGEDVTLDDGTVITSAEIRHPDMPEVVIFCKQMEFYDFELEKSEFSKEIPFFLNSSCRCTEQRLSARLSDK